MAEQLTCPRMYGGRENYAHGLPSIYVGKERNGEPWGLLCPASRAGEKQRERFRWFLDGTIVLNFKQWRN